MLSAKKVAFQAHELPEEKLGGMEAAAVLGIDPTQMFKTIVTIRPDGGKPVLALVPAPSQLDLKALGRVFAGKKMRVSSQAEAENLTGLQVGGISPLALVGKGFDVVLDETSKNFEAIYISGGQRGLNLSLAPNDVIELTRARVARISE